MSTFIEITILLELLMLETRPVYTLVLLLMLVSAQATFIFGCVKLIQLVKQDKSTERSEGNDS